MFISTYQRTLTTISFSRHFLFSFDLCSTLQLPGVVVLVVVGVQLRRTNTRRRETHFTNFETKTFRYLLRCRDQVNLDKNVMDRIESGEEK